MLFRALVAGFVALSMSSFGDSSTLPTDGDFRDLEAEFQMALDRLREVHGFPGATAAFALSDGRVAGVATGVSDAAAGTPMLPGDRMFSGSIGKTFVAATVLSLAAEGKLDLNAPISTWLGVEPWFDDLIGGESITVRHLLNHSSGVRDHVEEPGFVMALGQRIAAGRMDDPFEPEELVRFVLRKEPHFKPGLGFHYTDTGYILLGLTVEIASGESYYDLVERRYLGPRHLTLTSPATSRRISGLIPGYLEADNPLGFPTCSMSGPGELFIHPGTEWTGGGGLVTNSQDLVRWGMALYHEKILGPDSTVSMLTETSEVREETGVYHYGFGVYIIDTPLGVTYGHGGSYPGYNSQLAYFPDKEFCVAVQINRDFDNPRMEYIQALAQPILRALAMSESP